MNRTLFALIALAACGRVRFDPTGDGGRDGTLELMTYRDVVLADAPSAYWRLSDLGASTTDETTSYPGTLEGTCVLDSVGALTGDANRAMTFDGTSCNVSLGDALDFPGIAPFTIEAWARPRIVGNYQIILMHQTRTGPDPLDGYAVLLGPDGVYVERVVSAVGDGTESQPLVAGQFAHIVATFDGTATAMFIDGAQRGASVPSPMVMPVVTAETTIGATFEGTAFFDGTLDEVAVYDHVLTADRIALHYDVGINGPR